jgi:hypothetical protein
MMTLYGDVEFQSGEAEGVSAVGTDVDVGGIAFLIGASASLDMADVHLEFGYGSGDDNATDNEIDTFMTSLSGIQKFTYVYDYRAMTAGVLAPNAGLGGTNTGIANTMYVNFGAGIKPTPDLTASLDLYWLKAAEEVSTGALYKDDDIGWEVDGKVKYQLDKNLVYFAEGGVLFAGDIYKNATAGADPDNAWVLRHGVELTF